MVSLDSYLRKDDDRRQKKKVSNKLTLSLFDLNLGD